MGAMACGIANGYLSAAEPMLHQIEAAGSILGNRSGHTSRRVLRPPAIALPNCGRQQTLAQPSPSSQIHPLSLQPLHIESAAGQSSGPALQTHLLSHQSLHRRCVSRKSGCLYYLPRRRRSHKSTIIAASNFAGPSARSADRLPASCSEFTSSRRSRLAPFESAMRRSPLCRVVETRQAYEGGAETTESIEKSESTDGTRLSTNGTGSSTPGTSLSADGTVLKSSNGGEAQTVESSGFEKLALKVRDCLSIDDLWWEILVVSFPALLALAADPVASLFETSLLGNLGPAQLAAAGVSINVFNTLCKLFNFPLLNVTTSFVAEAESQRQLEQEELLKTLNPSWEGVPETSKSSSGNPPEISWESLSETSKPSGESPPETSWDSFSGFSNPSWESAPEASWETLFETSNPSPSETSQQSLEAPSETSKPFWDSLFKSSNGSWNGLPETPEPSFGLQQDEAFLDMLQSSTDVPPNSSRSDGNRWTADNPWQDCERATTAEPASQDGFDEVYEGNLRERQESGRSASSSAADGFRTRSIVIRTEGEVRTGDGVWANEELQNRAPIRTREQRKESRDAPFLENETNGRPDVEWTSPAYAERPVNNAVSASIIVGAALGIVESLVLGFGASHILGLYGVNSEMMGPASMYLALRAIGAPALVVSLAVSGAFRGFGDTKTPLYAQVASNALNVALLPLFMFSFGWGIAGAATATVFSQYVQMSILLFYIAKRCRIAPHRWRELKFRRFLGAGGVLLGRTLASLFTMSLATSMAARTGTASMAAHQICIQVWLAASLLSDSVALAGQTILARAFAQNDTKLIDKVAKRIMGLGLLMGGGMALAFLLGQHAIPLAFTSDPSVLAIIASLIPFIVLTQPINALAFVWDGLHYGASDFVYSAQVMVLASIPAMAAMFFLPQYIGIGGVWAGLAVLMSVRALLGVGRYALKSGPWTKLKEMDV